MRRRVLGPLAAALALAAALTLPGSASAGWKFGDTRYFTADQVCRDGAVVTAGWDKQAPAVPTDKSSITLGARLYTSTSLPIPPTGARVEEYGPLLTPQHTLAMVYHETPIQADINGNGSFLITFNVYGTETWAWSRLLTPGQTVIIHEGGVMLPATVADCFLHRPSVGRGASTPITPANLPLDPALAPPAATTYQVTSLPAHGRLLIDGAPAAVGARFTGADLASGRVRYAHDGSPAAPDSIGFSVRGVVRASVTAAGAEGHGGSQRAALSADGLVVAFDSDAPDLVPGDTNGTTDVFVRSTQILSTTRVSVTGTKAQATGGDSVDPSISADGNTVAFDSTATNMGGTTCSVYPSSTNAARDVYRNSLGTTFLVSESDLYFGKCYVGDGSSSNAAVSGDGSSVFFQSQATHLLARVNNSNVETGETDGNGTALDIFGGSTSFLQMLSRASGSGGAWGDAGSSSPSADRGGDEVAFASTAANLVGGDTNGASDIFVRTAAGNTVRLSVATGGAQSTGVPICFIICTTAGSFSPDITPSGRFVAFSSFATGMGGANDLVSDIYVRDRDTDGDGVFDEPGAVRTTLVSAATDGTLGDGSSFSPAISADGRFVAFESSATNLVPGDTNGKSDIFLRDRDTDGDGIFDEPGAVSTVRLSVAPDGAEADGGSFGAAISYDGGLVAFETDATNIAPGDTNGARDVVVVYAGYTSALSIEVLPANYAQLPLVVRP